MRTGMQDKPTAMAGPGPRRRIINGLRRLISKPVAPSRQSERLETIRQLMLHEINGIHKTESPLKTRIRFAQDIESLWYLRSELMKALSAAHGEKRAREFLHELTQYFEGTLPSGMRSRPSSLS